MDGDLAVPEEVFTLLADVHTFISQMLKEENLSNKAKEKREILLKKIKDVVASFPKEFADKVLEDGDESDGSFSSTPGDGDSVASDQYDKEDGVLPGGM